MTNFVLCIHVQIRFASTEKNYSHRLACILLPTIKAIISAISFSEEDSHYNKYNLYHLSGTNTLFNHV